jgi:hypothetical protein
MIRTELYNLAMLEDLVSTLLRPLPD